MKKPFKILSSTAMAAALATTALVPTAAAQAEVPAAAKQLDKVVFEYQGQLVTLDVKEHAKALAVGAVESKPTHVTAKDGSVYPIQKYSQALAIHETPEKALAALHADEAAVEVDLVPGKIVDKIVVTDEDTIPVKVVSVNATTINEVVVTFNQPVTEDMINAKDFTIDGKPVKGIELSEDKKTVFITVNDMDYGKDYKLVGKVGETTFEQTVTAPTVDEAFDIQIQVGKTEGKVEPIIADGVDTKLVTFTLIDKATGKPATDANDIVLELHSTLGDLSQERLTIQKGKGKVTLRSEFFAEEQKGRIDARVVESKPEKFKPLVGKALDSVFVPFVPEGADSEGGQHFVVKSLVAANSNEADRVTLTFDEEMSYADFYKDETLTKLRENLVIAQDETYGDRAHKFDIEAVEIDPNNKKKVIVYLDVKRPETGALPEPDAKKAYLTDNKDVYVEFTHENAKKPSKATFKLTDARKANVTSVKYLNPREIEVTFSEGIHSANFVIDGKWKEGTDFEVVYHDFNRTKFPMDQRNKATIKLKEETDNYFGGTHVIETSSIKDFAAVTDHNNTGDTQVLEFTAPKNEEVAKPTATVDSPEQIRIEFDQPIKKDFVKDNIKLQVKTKDKDGKVKWVDVKEHNFDGEEADYVITQPKDNVYKLEMTEDWTEIYNTKKTKQNHYNDEFRLAIPKYTTAINGKKVEKETYISLADTALSKPDIVSPTIEKVDSVHSKEDKSKIDYFDVLMSEPVKLADHEDSSGKPTVAQHQDELPQTQVEFLGKYKGKTYTFIGEVLGYNEEDPSDKTIQVMWDEDAKDNKFTIENEDGETVEVNTPQELVDNGGDTNWTLVLKSISDDVGNTSATTSHTFTLQPNVEQEKPEVPAEDKPFMVKPEGGEAIGNYDYSTAEGKPNNTFAIEGEAGVDTVTITYTESVAITGAGSAINVNNYTLNGKKLPIGTTIALGEEDNQVVITLPKGTLLTEENDSNVITLAKHIKSKDDKKDLSYDVAFTFKTSGEASPEDIAALEQKVNDLKQHLKENGDKYTPASKAAAEEAIKAAEETLASDEPTSTDINNAIKALEKAESNLTEIASKEELNKLIEKAKNVIPSKEAEEKLNEAIEDAEEVAKNEDATKDEVDETTKNLEKVIEESMLKLGELDYKIVPNDINQTSNIKIAEATLKEKGLSKIILKIEGEDKEFTFEYNDFAEIVGDKYDYMVNIPLYPLKEDEADKLIIQ